jgi:hypothetical protein
MRVRVLSTLLVAGVLAATPSILAASAVAATTSATTVAPGTFSREHRVVHRSPDPAPLVTAIRVGQHATFDRIVIQLKGSHAPGFDVRYVSQLRADPSDKIVNLLGPVSLRFVITPANGHDPSTGKSTLTTPKRTKWRLDRVRETAVIGDFEAVFTLGVGLQSKEPFRVLTLHHPTRIVVDVHH